MGLFNNYQKEGRGVSKDQKTPRFLLFFQILFRKFWNLIVVNMLYLVFCIPIVTIGPATAAHTKIMRNYAREEHAFIWGDFFETFRKNFKQAFIYSVVDFFVTAFLLFDSYVLLQQTKQMNFVMIALSMAAIFLTFTVWTFMRYYIYNMMITFRLTFKQLIKNAFIFCWAGFFRNLFITLILAALTLLLIFNVDLIVLLALCILIYPTFCNYFINFMVNPMIKKHMIDGYDPATGERIEPEKYEGFDDK